jgi:hypothetical protein
MMLEKNENAMKIRTDENRKSQRKYRCTATNFAEGTSAKLAEGT